MAEMLATDWGGNAGQFYECWKMEPCCGQPCNPADGCRCFLCWFCPIVNCLSAVKLYAHSTDQDCACINHCGPFLIDYLGIPFTSVTMRHNLRTKYGAGPPPMDIGGLVGDVACVFCCGPCTACQMLRSVDRDAWDWHKELTTKGFKASVQPCICCRH